VKEQMDSSELIKKDIVRMKMFVMKESTLECCLLNKLKTIEELVGAMRSNGGEMKEKNEEKIKKIISECMICRRLSMFDWD